MRVRTFALAFALAACSRHPPGLHQDSQALAWRSSARLSDADAKQIAADAVKVARSRRAWSESNHVHGADGAVGDGKEKFLYGEARLHLREYETQPGKFREVDADDDAQMAYADALFVFAQMQRWSSAHGVAFDVQLGHRTGRIDASGPDAAAQVILARLSKRAGDISAARAEAERPRLDAKYADRRAH
jgi:hypothetical protein